MRQISVECKWNEPSMEVTLHVDHQTGASPIPIAINYILVNN